MASSSPGSAHGADHTARLLISCPDGPGIVAAISGFLFEQGANIVSSDQYSTHPEHGTFFMRCAFYLPAIEAARRRLGAGARGLRGGIRALAGGSRWPGGSLTRTSAGAWR